MVTFIQAISVPFKFTHPPFGHWPLGGHQMISMVLYYTMIYSLGDIAKGSGDVILWSLVSGGPFLCSPSGLALGKYAGVLM